MSTATPRTKIVATLGPATQDAHHIAALIEAGASVFRLNFSHGTQAEHAHTFALVRDAAHALGRPVAVLGDLQGPKIRTGLLATDAVVLQQGATFTITTRPVPGDVATVSTTYEPLPASVHPGQRLLLADGKLVLQVTAVEGPDIRTTVVVGGELREHAGINLPDLAANIASLTEKDADDLRLCLDLGMDYIALSFVQTPADVLPVHTQMRVARRRTPVIAKIEKRSAIHHLPAIVRAFDGVMVAHGDLAVETSAAEVPVFQKRIINLARAAGKPVITATQMLESMTHSPTPTHAEASDVANAVWDGSDAVMLSGETAIGDYPVETVRTMAEIVNRAIGDGGSWHSAAPSATTEAESVVHAATDLAERLHVAAIVALTRSGRTAQLMSRERPRVPILAVTDSEAVYRRLALRWGVQPFVHEFVANTDAILLVMERYLTQQGVLAAGDTIVVTGSAPIASRGLTNFVKLHRVR